MSNKYLTPKQIAEKYVYSKHNALTDNQEIKDMIKDIEQYTQEQLKKCPISFIEKSTPQDKFKQLKKAVIEVTEQIDKETPWQEREPKWWVEMKDLQEQVKTSNSQ
jgi:hypothetical protein